jgi:hypothetical protein
MSELTTSPAAALAEAHHELLNDLAVLEQLIRPTEQARPVEVWTCLGDLRGHIGTHFRFEEQDGYMKAVLTRAPQHERKVRGLREEHDELWKSLADLIRQAGTLPALNDPFRQDLQAWIARVRDHEARENRLVEDAFNVDETAAD